MAGNLPPNINHIPKAKGSLPILHRREDIQQEWCSYSALASSPSGTCRTKQATSWWKWLNWTPNVSTNKNIRNVIAFCGHSKTNSSTPNHIMHWGVLKPSSTNDVASGAEPVSRPTNIQTRNASPIHRPQLFWRDCGIWLMFGGKFPAMAGSWLRYDITAHPWLSRGNSSLHLAF